MAERTLRGSPLRLRALVVAGLFLGTAGACSDTASIPTGPDTDPDPEPAVESTHQPTTLTSLGGTSGNGWVLNGDGVAAGWSDVSGGRAIVWSAEGAATDCLGRDSGTRGINDDGAIVGWARHDDGVQRAFVYVDGVRIDLEGLEPGVAGSAGDINADGLVVGRSAMQEGSSAVLWRPSPDGGYDPPIALGFGSPTEEPRINARGDIVFSAYVWSMHRPVLWRAGADGSYEEPIWLGRPADEAYYAMGINDQGVVVGARQQPWGGAPRVAVVWLPDDYDTPIDLGPGEAWAVNNSNQIVGVTGGSLPVFGGAARRPALWTLESDGSVTGPVDLTTPAGYQHGGARGINENGWIIGSSWGPGEVTATLWKPRS